VFFSDVEGDPEWKVVSRVDVRSRRSPLEFTADDSEVLSIGNDSDFDGLIWEYGENDVVPGEVPEPEDVFIPEVSHPKAGKPPPRETGERESENIVAWESSNTRGRR
jgi:hypothetical protein